MKIELPEQIFSHIEALPALYQGLLLALVIIVVGGGTIYLLGRESRSGKQTNRATRGGTAQAGTEQYIVSQGGQAPGAGGAGGASIGGGIGGKGGDGGRYKIHLLSQPPTSPGAGAAGASVSAPGWEAGGGGGGGEITELLIKEDDLAALREQGFDHFAFRVGEGGQGGPGEDTVVHLMTADNKILRTVHARGGAVGSSPRPIPSPPVVPSSDDIEKGFRLTSLIGANVIYSNHGMHYLMDAGWDVWHVDAVPYRIDPLFFCAFSIGDVSRGRDFKLKCVATAPDGFIAGVEEIIVSGGPEPASKARFAPVKLDVSSNHLGEWTVEVFAGERLLGTLEFTTLKR